MSDEKWLDKPTHDGWWWRACEDGSLSITRISSGPDLQLLGCYVGHGGQFRADLMNDRWLPITPPKPPAPPLPKSRQVTLTARVITDGRRGWEAQFHMDGREFDWTDGMTKEAAIQHCRDYGIEPEVQDE